MCVCERGGEREGQMWENGRGREKERDMWVCVYTCHCSIASLPSRMYIVHDFYV